MVTAVYKIDQENVFRKGDNSSRFEEWPNTTKSCIYITLFIITPITEYKYLGILFKPSGSFTKATELLCKKAKKALFCIYKTLNSDKLNILPNLKLFDSCFKPILLYCSEVLCRDIVER